MSNSITADQASYTLTGRSVNLTIDNVPPSDLDPYAPNARGLTDALIDFKDSFVITSVKKIVSFKVTTAANVTQGRALYMNSSGEVSHATNNGTLEEATVIGFANQTKSTGEEVDVLLAGVLSSSGLSPGQYYFLGSNGALISTAPTSPSANYLTRLGEAASTSEFMVQIEPAILLV